MCRFNCVNPPQSLQLQSYLRSPLQGGCDIKLTNDHPLPGGASLGNDFTVKRWGGFTQKEEIDNNRVQVNCVE